MKKAVVAAALGVASMGVLGGTATADPSASWHKSHAAWNDPKDDGGISIYEQASKDGTDEYVMGQFTAYDEVVTIWDHHKNGRKAIVKLWVGSSGPAVFYAHGDGTKRVIDGSYDEGQTVYLQACTSDSPNAVCTKKLAKGRS
ncbi:hypothetical protein ACXIZN_04895 [Amycolatopsis sp. TRM77291]